MPTVPPVTTGAVMAALREIPCPGISRDIVSIDLVGRVAVEDGRVEVEIVHTTEKAELIAEVKRRVEMKLMGLPGVAGVRVGVAGPGARAAAGAHGAEHGAAAAPQPEPGPAPLAGVRHVLAVASAKGGVGKSSVAVNLAIALRQAGRRVGLLDADVYGPSLPTMLGVGETPDADDQDGIVPVEAHGLQVVSMGLMVDPAQAIVWRGPMVHSAVRQLLREVRWRDLEILIVDLPPGTGDAQLTLLQTVPLAGAIIVTTPQEVALADVRRGLQMFARAGVKVLGIVENMSRFVCPCGREHDIFGAGGGRAEAARHGVPLLGEIPLEPAIRRGGDAGLPAAAAPDGPARAAFKALAEKVGAALP